MGANSLNRVFIKAYGKGASQGAMTDPSASATESLMLRYDTATVPIPAPSNPPPPRVSAKPTAQKTASQPVSQLQSIPGSMIADSASEDPSVQSAPDFSAWDAKMMSIMFGSSAVVAPNASMLQEQQSRPAMERAAIDPGQPDRRVNVGITPPVQTDHWQNQAAQSANNPAWLSNPSSQSTSNFSNSREQPLASTAPLRSSSSSIESQDLAERLNAKSASGEFFRLDRPAYAARAFDAQGMQSAMDVDDSDSHTHYDIELQQSMSRQSETMTNQSINQQMSAGNSFANNANSNAPHVKGIVGQPAPTSHSLKAREQQLRQATIKVFNPLWEVDRLEWPQVCSALSRSIEETSAEMIDNLLLACQDGLQILAVTSPQSGQGTSTVACCLAMLAGKHGSNVALVDGNIDNPSLSYQTNLVLDVDWHEAIAKRMPLEEIAVHSVEDQVTMIPLLERLNAPELSDQNVAYMLQELARCFDLVVVDLGHMSAPRNLVRRLGELGIIHAAVAVVDQRQSEPERIESCLRQIRQAGIASIGLVENFAA